MVSRRSGSGSRAFLECSPRLLAGGPAEIFTFVWTWLPPIFIGALSAMFLLSVARLAPRKSKES
jgi:hypothetical protein